MKNNLTVDIEPTNRCNASCHFCPRDATPHQGLMTQEVFDQALQRAVEFRDTTGAAVKVSLCGLGEPLINPKTPGFIRQVRDAGLECVMSSNGAMLDERRGRAILDAGIQQININVGDEGEQYEEVYKLPFEKTRDNVVRFAEMAGDQCEVNIVLVDYRQDRDHVKHMVRYWQDLGLRKFLFFDIMNRGGTLFIDHMQYETMPELAKAKSLLEATGKPAFCGIPFISVFVGYDGNYYLCCSDWTKQTSSGTVFDESFLSVTVPKYLQVTTREPVCKSCNWDPVNRVTDSIRAIAAGEETEADLQELIDKMTSTSQILVDCIEEYGIAVPEPSGADAPKRRIPVTTV
jgi:MoaA/NifB/PqqE/SkfB family radical SAM enzyme